MSIRLWQYLMAAVGVLLLAVAPGALRINSAHSGWVLVRIGSRPAQEDPTMRSGAEIESWIAEAAEQLDPTLLLLGMLGFLGVLGLIRLLPGASRKVDKGDQRFPDPVPWSCLASRAPPRAYVTVAGI